MSAATRLWRYGNLEDWMMGIKKDLFGVAEQSIALNKEQHEQIKQLYAENEQLIAQNKQLQAEVEQLKSGRTRIPVDERSPVEDGRYVVQLTAVTDLGTSKYTDVAFWVGEWSIHDNEARVTHWIDENLDSGLVEGASK